MNLFFASLKNRKKHEFHFLQAQKVKKPEKTWISFFASLKNFKNMNFIFASLKNLKKHEFHFLHA